MTRKTIDHPTWLDLSQAAEYLGVHFTTLRRWADAGEIAFVRTPGGRRRFTQAALDGFVRQMGQGSPSEPGAAPALAAEPAQPALPSPAAPLIEAKALQYARQSVQSIARTENWMARMSPEQRLRLKGTGHRLMALLLQYNSRSEGGEVYLEEGRRITSEYSQVCASIGLSLTETVHVFLFFRRSILDAVHETGYLGGSADYEGQQLYLRTTDYLDTLLLELINSYLRTQA